MYLVCHQDALDKWVNNTYKLDNKEDPSHPYYGVGYSSHRRYNLKTTKDRDGKELTDKDPIYLEYDRENRSMKLYSKVFEYYQSNLPAEMTFAIGVWLLNEGQEVEATFEYL